MPYALFILGDGLFRCKHLARVLDFAQLAQEEGVSVSRLGYEAGCDVPMTPDRAEALN